MSAAIAVPQELEQKALSLPEQARGLRISDQPTYDAAAAFLIDVIVPLRKEIEATFGPIKRKAHEAWQEAIAQEKRHLTPVTEAERIVKLTIGEWDRLQERLRREKQERERKEAEREQDEILEAQLEQAEAEQACPEELQAIIDQPITMPMPVVAPTYQRAAGISGRETWRAEVIDIRKLARAVADGVVPPHLVEANMTALNGMARSLKSGMQIPGVRSVVDRTISTRRR